MNQSIEVQMLSALEFFHYSHKFQNHLFIMVLEDEADLKNLITDLRVIHALAHLVTIQRLDEPVIQSIQLSLDQYADVLVPVLYIFPSTGLDFLVITRIDILALTRSDRPTLLETPRVE